MEKKTLVELVLIERTEKDKKGEYSFRRLDTKEIIPYNMIDVLNYPPQILRFLPHQKINSTINLSLKECPIHANAMLLGEYIQEQEDDYYAASFCRIKKKNEN